MEGMLLGKGQWSSEPMKDSETMENDAKLKTDEERVFHGEVQIIQVGNQ